MKFKLDKKKEESKFLLEGQIESKGESRHLKKRKRLEERRTRALFIFLSLTLMGSLAVLFYQQYTLAQKNEEVNALMFERERNPIYKDSMNILAAELDSLKKEFSLMKENNTRITEYMGLGKGVFFEIWIQGFKNFDASRYQNEQSRAFGLQDNLDAYVLARFSDFKNALLFENDMKKMGVKNVFIQGRIDGKLVDYKKALKHLQIVQQQDHD